jgi:hypothetical protein
MGSLSEPVMAGQNTAPLPTGTIVSSMAICVEAGGASHVASLFWPYADERDANSSARTDAVLR